MDSTARLALNKPNPDPVTGDFVDISVLNANFDKLDAAIGAIPVTSGTRPSAPFNGQFIRETDTGRVFLCVGTGPAIWVEVILGTAKPVARSTAQGNPVATATTAETLIRSLPSATYEANTAYQLVFRAQVNGSAVLDVTPRVRKGITTAGLLLADYGRLPVTVAASDRYFEFNFEFSVGAAPVTTQITFFALTSTGTLAFKGFSTGPLELRVTRIGTLADFSGLPVLS